MPPDPTTAICRSQAGIIGRAQALEAGLTARQIDHRLTTGRWSRLLPGIYLSADAPVRWDAWAHAALRAGGHRAVLVGETASQIRGLAPKRLPIWVAIPADRRCDVRHPNIRVLRLDVPDAERVTVDRLRTTTRLRTAIDLAHLRPATEAQPIIDRMLVRDQVDLDELTAAVNASRRHGSAQARQLIRSAHDHAAAESERHARRLLRAAGLTGWVGNYSVRVGGHSIKIDLALRRLRIAIEVKGWMFHSAGDRGSSDDARVTDLQLAGWLVIPVSWLTLHLQPEAFIAQVREAVAMRSVALAR